MPSQKELALELAGNKLVPIIYNAVSVFDIIKAITPNFPDQEIGQYPNGVVLKSESGVLLLNRNGACFDKNNQFREITFDTKLEFASPKEVEEFFVTYEPLYQKELEARKEKIKESIPKIEKLVEFINMSNQDITLTPSCDESEEYIKHLLEASGWKEDEFGCMNKDGYEIMFDEDGISF